jgi:hypothetical protein
LNHSSCFKHGEYCLRNHMDVNGWSREGILRFLSHSIVTTSIRRIDYPIIAGAGV